jgi:hypothetical protein
MYSNGACRLTSNPSRRVEVTNISKNASPAQFARELAQATAEFDALRLQTGTQSATRQSLIDAQAQATTWGRTHNALRRQYAEFSELDATTATLASKRPRTAPAEDLSRERQLILNGPGIDILLIQVALILAVLSLLSFLVLSRPLAQGVTFVLLSTGVAIGFFLRK